VATKSDNNCFTRPWLGLFEIFNPSNGVYEYKSGYAPFSISEHLSQFVKPDQNVYLTDLYQKASDGNYYATVRVDGIPSKVAINTSFVVSKGSDNINILFKDLTRHECYSPVSAKFVSGPSPPQGWEAYTGPTADLKSVFENQENWDRIDTGESFSSEGYKIKLVSLSVTGVSKSYKTLWELSLNGNSLKYSDNTPPFDLKDEFGDYLTESVMVHMCGYRMSDSENFALIEKQ
jgi:hypothetical protein